MHQRLPRVLAATGSFLLAVLWMDLMFDVQSLGGAGAVPSIAAYYRHVTVEAGWMTWLVAVIMLVTVVGVVVQARRSNARLWVRVTTPVLAFVPIALALTVVFPAARELAADPRGERIGLARMIAWSHIGCFAAMATFVALQLAMRVHTEKSQDRVSRA